MDQHNPTPDITHDYERVRSYSRGAQLVFENAEALYNEAQMLGQAGSFARAAALHQISMEECAKIDMLGAHATSILMGHEVDDDRIAKVFREHKLKNYANAYNATVTPAEEEARTRGDWKASSEAFKKFQRDFHVEVNTIKNAALYVDYKDGQFMAPKQAVTEPIAVAFMHLNAEFLQRSDGFVRLLRKMESDPNTYSDLVKRFTERAMALRAEGKSDPESVLDTLMKEMYADYASAMSRKD